MGTLTVKELKRDIQLALRGYTQNIHNRYAVSCTYATENVQQSSTRNIRIIELYYGAKTKNIFLAIIDEGKKPVAKFEGKIEDVHTSGSSITARAANAALAIIF